MGSRAKFVFHPSGHRSESEIRMRTRTTRNSLAVGHSGVHRRRGEPLKLIERRKNNKRAGLEVGFFIQMKKDSSFETRHLKQVNRD